jgi:eukaryotic-like serine/threonine-protein kinase
VEGERWRKIERLYRSALEREKSQRAAFIRQACGGDESLQQELVSLIARSAGQESALDHAWATGAAVGRADDVEIPRIPRTQAESFRGTERFELRRWLGAGGFGVVYEAYDRDHNATVALKTLQQMGAEALYRFKHEFRALADIAHPNLITLYELIADREHWFFTMELVEGVNFLRYVLPEAHRADLVPTLSAPRPLLPGPSGTMQEADPPPGAASAVASPYDCSMPSMDRLREAFRQLSEGVRALHEAGKLHCDLKPSNVLVERAGRVVILDFGLVAERDAIAAVDNNFVVGTPAYISPEQASGLTPSPASDWYSVGVMLFEALTGQRPFHGSVREILNYKGWRHPTAPLDLVRGLPQDLNDLCCRLLSRDPKLRPSDGEVLRCLGGDRRGVGEFSRSLRSISSSLFIGREHHLSVLREAFESTLEGRLVTVWVHGPSGVGKTALVRRFLDEARQRSDLVVLEGRCYEREAVPYKALDSVVDRVGRYVRSLPPAEAEALMPLDLPALIRLFPVLQEWRALRSPSAEVSGILDLKELRRRGFAAFRQILDGIAARKPLVVFIDDLQWGDTDSVTLLADLIKGGSAAALLFVACYRGEEAESSPLLRRLLPLRPAHGGRAPSMVDLELQELDPAHAAELTAALLKEAEPAFLPQAESIAREAAGNPFFISELVRYAEVRGDLQTRSSVLPEGRFSGNSEESITPGTATQAWMRALSLSDVIRARFSRLSMQSLRLLEVVAVAGQPVDLQLAKRAARISGGGHAELHQLRTAHLVRTRKTEGSQQVEAYHDRIREATEASLDQETLKQHHYHLAIEWEASTQAEPRVLAIHFRGAGIPDKAFHYAVEAADQAAEALAFGSAAEFYRFALELELGDVAAVQALRVKLGDALSNAGRGEKSAEAYLAAARSARGVEKLELQRCAAAQLMMSGRTDQGLALTREVLAAVGMKPAVTTLRSVLTFFLWRAFIRLRGLRFRDRSAAEISARDLLRIDLCWSLIQGLGMVDPLQAHQFLPRQLLLALRSGDAYRITRAVSTELAYLSLAGGRHRLRVEKLLQMARDLAGRSQHPHAIGIVALVSGMSAFLRGDWKDATQRMDRAETILRERCTGVAWEIATAHMMGSVSLFLMGELNELGQRLPRIIKEAQARGDLYEVTDLRTRLSHIVHLAADEPAEAHQELDAVLEQWRRKAFDLQHWWVLIGRIEIDLYSGEPDQAWKRVMEQWSGLRWSFLLRIEYVLLESLHHRARAALALACNGSVGAAARRRLLRVAARDAAGMKRHNMPWGNALAALTQAGIAAARGDSNGAMSLLTTAEAGFEATDMALYAAATRRRRGQLIGGTEGHNLTEAAEAWMARQHILNRERMTAMLAPGGWPA